jgi:hypothetical protein
MSPAAGDRRHSADRAEPIILSKPAGSETASAFVPHAWPEEDTMRHSVVTTKLVRQARAALDEEAAQRPVRNPEPQPPQAPPRSRLASVARRLRALAARTLRRPRPLRPRTEPR